MTRLLICAATILTLICATSAAVAQRDTLYGPRGFLGGVRADWVQIIQYCQANGFKGPRLAQCTRAEAKRRPVTLT
jgi:hypothetical protein